jgi:hypothetical protein
MRGFHRCAKICSAVAAGVFATSIACTDGRRVCASHGVTLVDSKAVRSLFSVVRNKASSTAEFQNAAGRLMTLLCEEALADLPGSVTQIVDTPCGRYAGHKRPDFDAIVVVSVMRAGDAMLEVMRRLEPKVKVGKLLIQRDESSRTKAAHVRFLSICDRSCITDAPSGRHVSFVCPSCCSSRIRSSPLASALTRLRCFCWIRCWQQAVALSWPSTSF